MTSGGNLISQAVLLVYSELIQAARYRGFTTYQRLAHVLGLVTGNRLGQECSRLLEHIARLEEESERPMLTALCVTTEDLPSTGFWPLVEEFRGVKLEGIAERRKFWQEERERIYTAWAQTFYMKS